MNYARFISWFTGMISVLCGLGMFSAFNQGMYPMGITLSYVCIGFFVLSGISFSFHRQIKAQEKK